MKSDKLVQIIDEQFGIIKELVQTGEAIYDDVYQNIKDYIDPVLCGNRVNSPVFLSALRKRLRQSFPEHDEDIDFKSIVLSRDSQTDASFYRSELAWCLQLIKGIEPDIFKCQSISQHLSNIERSIA